MQKHPKIPLDHSDIINISIIENNCVLDFPRHLKKFLKIISWMIIVKLNQYCLAASEKGVFDYSARVFFSEMNQQTNVVPVYTFGVYQKD